MESVAKHTNGQTDVYKNGINSANNDTTKDDLVSILAGSDKSHGNISSGINVTTKSNNSSNGKFHTAVTATAAVIENKLFKGTMKIPKNCEEQTKANEFFGFSEIDVAESRKILSQHRL